MNLIIVQGITLKCYWFCSIGVYVFIALLVFMLVLLNSCLFKKTA